MLVFNNDWTWRGKGVLSHRIRVGESIQELFTALIEEVKEAGNVFQKFLVNDQRLVGQERHDLAEELEDLLGGFFCLYKYILKIPEGPFDSRYCDNGDRFTVEFDGVLWRVEGVLKQNALRGSFTDWFNGFLIPKTGRFIKTYGAAFADGIMDAAESEELLSTLNTIIFQILMAEKGLKSGLLS